MVDAISAALGIGKLVSAFKTSSDNKKMAEAQLQLQRRAYHRGIRDRVEDARAAGIHPLAALGAPIAGPSGGIVPSGDAVGDALGDLGNLFADREMEELKREALRSDIRRTDADTVRLLTDASSRSLIAGARRGATDPSPPTVRSMGVDFQRDPTKYSSADVVQQEFGEVGENIVGIPALINAWSRAIGNILPIASPLATKEFTDLIREPAKSGGGGF